MSFECEKGDIWRMSRAKDIPIKDWIRLAVERGQIEKYPVVFWLDKNRAHDAEMIKKVEKIYLNSIRRGLKFILWMWQVLQDLPMSELEEVRTLSL